jgi:sialic acid synthase SpsE
MLRSNGELNIQGREISWNNPAYFIADIAANHDGELSRAVDLIYLAKEAGADAAKFQHFKAESIVSDAGFRAMGAQESHQATWGKSVFEVYRDASIDLDWTPTLKEACDKAGIAFFTSPYSVEIVDNVDPYVPAYKIGSGDITWHEIIAHIANKGKPYILASGASTMDEVVEAVELALEINPKLALLQCNTNYTGSLENFRYVQLNVLQSYRAMFPDLVLGLSDHTPGHATVLGAVALGARIIEKHFTDDSSRSGPDHAFSMDPISWRDMVERTRELENALGNGIKRVEENERQTVVLQRRSLRLRRDLPKGHVLVDADLVALRPCPVGAITPSKITGVLGKSLREARKAGDALAIADLEPV